MTVLNIVALALVLVVGCGAHKVYLWLVWGFTCVVSVAMAKRLSFVITVVLGAALCYPFLVPQDTVAEVVVWFFYLGLAGVGAWHIYDVCTHIKLSFHVER